MYFSSASCQTGPALRASYSIPFHYKGDPNTIVPPNHIAMPESEASCQLQPQVQGTWWEYVLPAGTSCKNCIAPSLTRANSLRARARPPNLSPKDFGHRVLFDCQYQQKKKALSSPANASPLFLHPFSHYLFFLTTFYEQLLSHTVLPFSLGGYDCGGLDVDLSFARSALATSTVQATMHPSHHDPHLRA
jgi:hypothetical protein